MIRQYPCLIFLSLTVALPGLHAQSPGGVSTNLAFWAKAESALPVTSGTLTKWTESTGINKLTLSGSGMSTVTNAINFHPVVNFTGSGKLVGNTSITWSEVYAVVSWTGNTNQERGTVISPTTSGTNPNDASRYYFRSGVESNPGNFLFSGMGIDSIGFEYVPSPANGVVNEYTASGVGDVFNRNGLDARVGSLFGGFTKRATTMNGIPQIGDRSTNDAAMKGNIAEIIVYSSDNATNRNKVESYLALKYGLTLGNKDNTVNYISSGNKIFWNGVSNYQHNIFGIGFDQASGLTQSPSNSINSGSGNGAGQSGLGNLQLTAIASFTDQQFLMIGTDSASLSTMTMTTTNGPPVAAGSTRVIRTWLVQNTNTVGAVKLGFDVAGLGLSTTTPTNYYLMIDNDGDGNFTTGAISFVKAASITGTVVNFTPVTLKNNVVFTIITLPNTLIPLPISFDNFSAVARQDTADLQWTVHGQPNTDPGIDHFVIERSSDANNFIAAGSLSAANMATATNNTTGSEPYEFRETLTPGVYYYRIRLVSRDGNEQFSAIRSVIISGNINSNTALLQIRSNPVRNNQLQLRIVWPQNNTALIRIADRQGNVLIQKEIALQQGANLPIIDCSRLTGGLYFVSVRSGNEMRVLSFLK